ncbi:MAG: hypothetical protein QW614_01790 [Candidatus Caldarchaeum sp.]|uniref:Uncharacterized protein n=1 Tax=Caldiarchaeum subterraneum TaxID=311458 RepID=A0A7C5L692_CALS0
MRVRTLFIALSAVVVVVLAAWILATGSVLDASDIWVKVSENNATIFLNLHNKGLLPDCATAVEVIGEGSVGTISLRAGLYKTTMDNNLIKVSKICVNPLSTVKLQETNVEGYRIIVLGDVEKIKVYHIYITFESGEILHLHAVPGIQHQRIAMCSIDVENV